MKKIRTAIVGAGKMGAIHAKVYHQLDKSEIVAVVDTNIQRAKKLAGKYKCSAYENCLEIIISSLSIKRMLICIFIFTNLFVVELLIKPGNYD